MAEQGDEMINLLRAKAAVLSKRMRKQKREDLENYREKCIEELYEAVRKGDSRTIHRLGRRLANTGIGTKHRKYGHIAAGTPPAD